MEKFTIGGTAWNVRTDAVRHYVSGCRSANRSIWIAAKAGDIGAIKRHLAKGTAVNVRNESGQSPLTFAALAGQESAARYLIENGADVNVRDNDGNTVLHGAAFLGRLTLVELLVQKGTSVDAVNKDGHTAKDVSSEPWSDEVREGVIFVAGLLQVKIDPSQVMAARPKAAALIAKLGGKSASELAGTTRDRLWNVVKSGDLARLKQILDGGTDLERLNDEGVSALAWAGMCGQTKAVEMLIQRGSDVNQRNRDGSTALHGAVLLGRTDVVELLLEDKANVNVMNDDNQTPLDIVTEAWNAKTKRVIQFVANLLEIPVNLKKIQEARPRIAQMLRDHGAMSRKN